MSLTIEQANEALLSGTTVYWDSEMMTGIQKGVIRDIFPWMGSYKVAIRTSFGGAYVELSKLYTKKEETVEVAETFKPEVVKSWWVRLFEFIFGRYFIG